MTSNDYIRDELKRINGVLEIVREEVGNVRVDIKGLQTRNAIWASLGGLGAGGTVSLFVAWLF